MRIKNILYIGILVSTLVSQDQYRSVQKAQDDWGDYTKFQKHELLSFCDFLINEGFHERALLSLFQYLYRYPGDSLETAVYYYIAQSYEYSESYDLAERYYTRTQELSDSSDMVFKAAEYRKMYLLLEAGEYDQILDNTELSEDPYDLTFRGYAFFHKLQWIEARQSFLAAEEQFDHPFYSKRLEAMFKAIDASANVPLRNKWLSLAASLVPGGGHAYLEQWESAGGMLASMILVSTMISNTSLSQAGKFSFDKSRQSVIPLSSGIKTENDVFTSQRGYAHPNRINLSTKNVKILMPPALIGAGLYFGGIWKTWMDVDEANHARVERYVGKVAHKIAIDIFLDYPEPELINQ